MNLYQIIGLTKTYYSGKSYQTDNKQATANKENENFMVQEKKSTKMPGKYSPKKD